MQTKNSTLEAHLVSVKAEAENYLRDFDALAQNAKKVRALYCGRM